MKGPFLYLVDIFVCTQKWLKYLAVDHIVIKNHGTQCLPGIQRRCIHATLFRRDSIGEAMVH